MSVRIRSALTLRLGALGLVRAHEEVEVPEDLDAGELVAESTLAQQLHDNGALVILEDDRPPRGAKVEAAILAMRRAEKAMRALSEEERDLVLDIIRPPEPGRRAPEDPDDDGQGDGQDEPPAAPGPPGVDAEVEMRPDGEGAPPPSLRDLKIDEAAPLIADATDADLLQLWRDTDERKGIHSLIDERLEELTKPE